MLHLGVWLAFLARSEYECEKNMNKSNRNVPIDRDRQGGFEGSLLAGLDGAEVEQNGVAVDAGEDGRGAATEAAGKVLGGEAGGADE
jgi:hypothetical protein